MTSTRTPTGARSEEPPSPRRTVLRTSSDRLSVRVPARSLAATAGVLVALALTGVCALAFGEVSVAPLDVVRTLLGNGSRLTDLVVLELRLPRLATGVLVGAALGLSGAVFQSLSRNPLGSPDLIGFTQGSATGALVVITLVGGSSPATAGGAVLGGLATAVVVYLLAWRNGVRGYRLVLVGIGVSAVLQSVNFYLMVTAELADAARATVWLTGTLQNRGWEHAVPAGAAVLLVLPAAVLVSRRLRIMEMGDDVASALGIPAERSRLSLLAVATAAAAAATAAAGPITFVALTAPQLAKRVTRTSGPNVLPAAAVGALITVLADVASQNLAPTELPAGVTTAAIGGAYLSWLLWRGHRKSTTAA